MTNVEVEENEPIYELDMTEAVETYKQYGDRLNQFYSLLDGADESPFNFDTETSSGGDMSSFKSKLEKVESGGSYDAYNEGSGAYGKYQFIPSTLKEYAKKTGQTIEQAKTPEGQDKMFEKFTSDNATRLQKMGIAPTELNMWIAHNQGIGGAASILKAKKLTPNLKRNIASNLPEGVEPTIDNYVNHWKQTFNA